MLIINPQKSNIFNYRTIIQKESRKTFDVSSENVMTNPIKNTSGNNFVAYPLINFTGTIKPKSRLEQGREIANNLYNEATFSLDDRR